MPDSKLKIHLPYPHFSLSSVLRPPQTLAMFNSPRTNARQSDLSQLGHELLQALAAAADSQMEGLQQTRDTQVAMTALLQTEAQRLQNKYGPDHSRVQQINTTLQRNTAIVNDLAVELEIATIRQPDVDEKSALVQGRVVDQHYRGMAGLVVYLGNEQRQPLRFLGTAETDSSGYYALTLAPEALAKLAEAAPDGVFLGVCTPQGRVVYQRPEAILPQAGDRLTLEVVLQRNDLSPIDGGKPVEPPGAKDWVVRGQVVDANTGEAIAGVQVSAIDNNRRFDDKLGTAITDAKGSFRITYDFQSPHGTPAKQGPDLYVTVIDEAGNQLFSSQSQLRHNASRDEEFKVAIAASTTPDSTDLPLNGSVIWFATGSTKFRQDDDRLNGERLLKLAIRRAQQFIRQNPNGQIALQGYASSEDGTLEAALALAQKRAEMIQALLVQANLPANQLSATAPGIDDSYAEVSLNQRVDIVLLPGRLGRDRIGTRPSVNRFDPSRS